MYRYIKEYYLLGLYTEENLQVFVNAKWITEEQKQEIINSKINTIRKKGSSKIKHENNN